VTATGNFSIFFESAQAKKSDRNFFGYKYYPFGLQTASSWTRTTATQNNFLYNEASELNTTSSLYDLPYRTYDPVLGRMNGVDPLASKYGSLTPYNYAANDPVYWTDPSGADMLPFCSTCGGFGIEMQNGLGSYSESAGWGGYGSSGWGNFLGSSAIETSMSWNSSFYGGPDYGQLSKDAEAVRNGDMSHQEYGAKHGTTIYSNGQFGNGGDGFFYTVSTPYGVNLGYNFGAVVAGANSRGSERIQQQQTQTKSEFYYNTLDGLVLNDGTVLSKNDLVLMFDNLPFSDARYLGFKNGRHHVNFSIKSYQETKANIRATAIHEIYGHGIKGYGNANKTHHLAYFSSIDSKYWKATTDAFKTSTVDNMWGYYYREVGYQRMPELYQTMYDLYRSK
jgi:RHS repeat-associated protein